MKALTGPILVVLLGASGAARADAPCPTDADIHTADWKTERAMAEMSRESRLLKDCRKAHRGKVERKAACVDEARSEATSNAAARKTLEDEGQLLRRICEPAIDVPRADPDATKAR